MAFIPIQNDNLASFWMLQIDVAVQAVKRRARKSCECGKRYQNRFFKQFIHHSYSVGWGRLKVPLLIVFATFISGKHCIVGLLIKCGDQTKYRLCKFVVYGENVLPLRNPIVVWL